MAPLIMLMTDNAENAKQPALGAPQPARRPPSNHQPMSLSRTPTPTAPNDTASTADPRRGRRNNWQRRHGAPQPDRPPPPSSQLECAAPPDQDALRPPHLDYNHTRSPIAEPSVHLAGEKYNTGWIVACVVVTFTRTISVAGMRRVKQELRKPNRAEELPA
ncbi:hypothetical protein FN846DRAFT_908734 [Sphaerosporella brunnea]|uniref:Uncharacterized protein n=1 Tax=Sphaerosporella brunnea TaxID=1250544 RepID=A0A5J5ESX0_9PEZI|nr:hypothetical protein FN846DRAFT_908734 [Sphaerosporella brunnea]